MKLQRAVSFPSSAHVSPYALRNPLQHRSRFQYEGRKNNFAKIRTWLELGDDM